MADRDTLTPTYNRRAFIRELHRTMSEVERYKTPAAVLYAAGTPQAHTWIGDLSGIGLHQPPPGDLPATIVIGDVVTLAAEIGRVAAPADAAQAQRAVQQR